MKPIGPALAIFLVGVGVAILALRCVDQSKSRDLQTKTVELEQRQYLERSATTLNSALHRTARLSGMTIGVPDLLFTTDEQDVQDLRSTMEYELYDGDESDRAFAACSQLVNRDTVCLYQLDIAIASGRVAIDDARPLQCWQTTITNDREEIAVPKVLSLTTCITNAIGKHPSVGAPLSFGMDNKVYRGPLEMRFEIPAIVPDVAKTKHK